MPAMPMPTGGIRLRHKSSLLAKCGVVIPGCGDHAPRPSSTPMATATLAFWYEGVPLSFPNLAKWEPTWYTPSHAAVFQFLGYEWPPRWTTLSDEIVIDFTGIEGRRELECLFCYLAHWPVEDKDVNQWHSVNLNDTLSHTLAYKGRHHQRMVQQ